VSERLTKLRREMTAESRTCEPVKLPVRHDEEVRGRRLRSEHGAGDGFLM